MTNYFHFFGLPVSPQLDTALLKQLYYTNSRRFHPDFFTLEEEEKQAEALELSTLNNEAYKVLANEESRLQHLLQLKGRLLEEGQHSVPQEFLLTVMELNELLMELEMDEAPSLRAQAAQALASLKKQIKEEAQPIINNYDDKTASEIELNQLLMYYLKQRYLLRIQEKIKAD